MKRILGLDLGTNSIGWALVEISHETNSVTIVGLGSRIIPMDAGEIKTYKEGGAIASAAAQRTEKRGARKNNQRFILRRDRLHLVLNLLNALPQHYKINIHLNEDQSVENRKDNKGGQFKNGKESKLAFKTKENGKKAEFLFMESYLEMLSEIDSEHASNKKRNRIPYDWTLYYLRQKALKEKISLEEFAWVLLSYNQKRGYQKTEANSEESELTEKLKSFGLTKGIQKYIDLNKLEIESFPVKVKSVCKVENEDAYKIELEDGFVYEEYSSKALTEIRDGIDEVKMVEKISFLNSENEVEDTKTIIKIQDNYTLQIEAISIEQKDKKTEHTFIYNNGWTRDLTRNYQIKGIKKNIGNEIEVIATSLYNLSGLRIKPSTKKISTDDNQLVLNLDKECKNPYKMDIATKDTDWQLLKIKTEKETLKYNAQQGFFSENGIKKYISPKIYDTLKIDARKGHFHRTKIIGGKFQTIERDFYREELKQIIATQKKHHGSVLEDKAIIDNCVKMLYPKNKAHAKSLMDNKDTLTQLLVEDILLYHRPLKSKKSEIADCKFEIRNIKDGKTHFHKAIPVSHPLFQEFRIWDKIHNLKLIQIEKTEDGTKKTSTNVDVTKQFFTNEFYQKLYAKFNSKNTVTKNNFINLCFAELKLEGEKSNYTWNYPDDEEFKGNQTKTSFKTRFNKAGINVTEYETLMTEDKEIRLWHYLYSVPYNDRVKKDKNGKENASLRNFIAKLFKNDSLEAETLEALVKTFVTYPKFESRYGAYSEKSIKKLLPFLRIGKFNGSFDLSEFKQDLEAINYNANNINTYLGLTQEKLDKVEKRNLENKKQALHKALWQHSINQRILEILERKTELEFDNDGKTIYDKAIDVNAKIPFPKGLFNAFKDYEEVSDFTKFNLTQASYLVYGRHSELAEAKHWTSPDMIRTELQKELKQNSLNNPVAEKIIREMMQVVADIWAFYGEFELVGGEKNYKKLFDEIHIEVARELKKNAKQKKNAALRNTDNRKQNKRLRQILSEFLSQAPYNAEPSSKNHFEKLKILEESAIKQHFANKEFYNNKEFKDAGLEKKDAESFIKESNITKAMFEKYKLWVEQGYQSPYSGQMIPLSSLFDGDKYDIDHIFPQALITNDSLNNKVVCEKVLNKEKGSKTARKFIQDQNGVAIDGIPVCDEETYLAIVSRQFSGTKKYILNSVTIPKGFTDSQLNTTRHIARKAMELLSHIVRDEGEVEYRSKHVLPVTGLITNKLKKAWQLNDVWSNLMAPRFKRMNTLTNSELFGRHKKTREGEAYFECKLDDKLLELNPDFDIKRIDHRHHALDALLVALCTEDHVNYINNINAGAKSKDYGKQKQIEKYRQTLKRKIKWSEPRKDKPNESNWYFMQPGEYRINHEEAYSREDTVQKMDFFYKDLVSNTIEYGHKPIVFEALNDVITSFKQNKRVINRSYYKIQKRDETGEKYEWENKVGWSVRRSLGKETFYGNVNLKLKEKKKLHTSLTRIFNDIDCIVNTDAKTENSINYKEEFKQIKLISKDLNKFKKKVKEKYENVDVELYYFTEDTKNNRQLASRYQSELSEKFNSKKIKTITDTGIQKILINHLKQFDTIELPYNQALKYFKHTLEKETINHIIATDVNFSTIDDFTNHLFENNFKYKKTDYKTLNVFIDKIEDVDYRSKINNKELDFEIKEHPEIAFNTVQIELMNEKENLKRLNNGKSHKPIYVVRTYGGLGKQRIVSKKSPLSKSKQYVINDAGSNIFLGVYERSYLDKEGGKVSERKFRTIDLLDLIEFQKENGLQSPFEEKIFDTKGNEFNFIFELTPGDLVSISIDGKKIFYVLNDFNDGKVYFSPVNHSAEINNNEVDKRFDDKGDLIGSQSNKTENYKEEKIKNICLKENNNRLGQVL